MTAAVAAATAAPEEENNKKKVGLAAASQEDLKRIVAMGQKARLVALKRMKEESGGLPLKMGLATVDKATRQKIASARRKNYERDLCLEQLL